MVAQGRFSEAIAEKIKKSISTEEVTAEIETLKKEYKKKLALCSRLGTQLDELDDSDPAYEWKYADLQKRQDEAFLVVSELNGKIEVVQRRLDGIRQKQITQDSVLKFLQYFDKLFSKFEETEKREFLQVFISEIQIYPEKQPNGQILKEIRFNFPVIELNNGSMSDTISLESETPVETVCLITQKMLNSN